MRSHERPSDALAHSRDDSTVVVLGVAAVIAPKGATQMRIRLIALTLALAFGGLAACQSPSAPQSAVPTENARPYSVLAPEDCRLIRCHPSPFL